MDPTNFFQRKELQELFKGIGVEVSTAKLIRANTNLIYDCGRYIIRLTPASVRTKLEIESELAWLIYLAQEEAPVVELISGNHPLVVEVDSLAYWGVVFTKIGGRKVEASDWTESHFEKLGQLTGQLHRLGQDYNCTTELHYQHWDEIPEFHNYPRLSQSITGGVELHHQVVTHLKTLEANANNYGLVHYDIHQGNYLLEESGTLMLFDFELCCRSWYIHDVAIVLYYAESHPQSSIIPNFQRYFLDHFWQGYQGEFLLPSQEERQLIPTFLLYRDLMVYAYLLEIWADKTLNEQQNRYKQRIEGSIAVRRRHFEG